MKKSLKSVSMESTMLLQPKALTQAVGLIRMTTRRTICHQMATQVLFNSLSTFLGHQYVIQQL